MKENQKFGLVTLVTAVVLFVSLMLPLVAFHISVPQTLFSPAMEETSRYGMFAMLREMGNAWWVLAAIASLALFIILIAMMVGGVLLLIDKRADYIIPRYQRIMFVAGGGAVLVGVLSVFAGLTTAGVLGDLTAGLLSGASTSGRPAIGGILLLLLGIGVIAMSLVVLPSGTGIRIAFPAKRPRQKSSSVMEEELPPLPQPTQPMSPPPPAPAPMLQPMPSPMPQPSPMMMQPQPAPPMSPMGPPPRHQFAPEPDMPATFDEMDGFGN
ncbi:MAG: hypothetical protein FWE38_00600 [Firmicutes bacterium]|nr:hypothetical protein [Bacillota bacterium]